MVLDRKSHTSFIMLGGKVVSKKAVRDRELTEFIALD